MVVEQGLGLYRAQTLTPGFPAAARGAVWQLRLACVCVYRSCYVHLMLGLHRCPWPKACLHACCVHVEANVWPNIGKNHWSDSLELRIALLIMLHL